MTREYLIEIISKICQYAQNHSHNWENRARDADFEHVSHVVACFIAQNTPLGSGGVESDVASDLLEGPVLRDEDMVQACRELVALFYEEPDPNLPPAPEKKNLLNTPATT